MRRALRIAAVCVALAASSVNGDAAPTWVRVESPNFTVVSDAGEPAARGVAWQFEQIRAVLERLWPWARLDTGRPLLVYAVKDEHGMRGLAPGYWEQKGGVHPTSLFMTAADRHYLVVRTDTTVDAREVNPFRSSYWSYVGVVIDASFGRSLPMWFTRGLAEVMSNTIVRSEDITVGQIVPWNLRRLQRVAPIALDELTSATRDSKYMADATWMELFDASSWALVHFLMFGERGANLPRFNQAATAMLKGADVDGAVANAFGGRAWVAAGYAKYATQPTFTYQRVNIDVDVRRDDFKARVLTPAESAATRSLFLAASGRGTEASALVADARRSMPDLPMTFEAEGLLADRAGNADAARTAWARASDLGAGYYADYRHAYLSWPDADTPERAAVLGRLVTVLERSIAANGTYAPSRGLLAQALLGLDRAAEAWPHAQRANALSPGVSSFHLTAARALWALGKREDARREADTAVGLASAPADRRNALEFQAFISRSAG